MIAETLVTLALMAQTVETPRTEPSLAQESCPPNCYFWLPSNPMCAKALGQCEADYNRLIAEGANPLLIDDALNRKQAWLACWWIVWPTTPDEQRRQWEERLRGLIGDQAFESGRLPMPISWRVR